MMQNLFESGNFHRLSKFYNFSLLFVLKKAHLFYAAMSETCMWKTLEKKNSMSELI